MSFFQLVRREMHASVRKLVFMSALGGVSNAAILTAINTGAGAADDRQSRQPVGGDTVSGRAVRLLQDPGLYFDDHHGGNRSDHSQASRAPDGLCPALGIAGGRGDRAVADHRGDHQRFRDPDASEQYAHLLDSGPGPDRLRRDLCGLSVVRGLRAERRDPGDGRHDLPFQEPPSDRREGEGLRARAEDLRSPLPISSTASRRYGSTVREAKHCSKTPSRCRGMRPISRSTPRPKPSSRSPRRRAICTSCSARSCSSPRNSATLWAAPRSPRSPRRCSMSSARASAWCRPSRS